MNDKPIKFVPHAYFSMKKRGTTEKEITETIYNSQWKPAKHHDRWEAEREFPYNAVWNNKFYKCKKVNPVFKVEKEEILVITVYTFYY